MRRLCRELGYFGLFEVEFLYCDGAWAVIDFNPRTFNQIGMDVYRGMPLPYFACLEALGDQEALRTAINASQEPGADRLATVFCDRFTLQAMLFARVLTRRISRDELTRWRRWLRYMRRTALMSRRPRRPAATDCSCVVGDIVGLARVSPRPAPDAANR